MPELFIEPLTVEAFRPYGQVIEASEKSTNQIIVKETVKRYNKVAHVENSRGDCASANLCVFKSTASQLPFDVTILERHPYSTQAFIPMGLNGSFLVIVACGDDAPDLSTLRAFKASGTQGISYNVAAWHHPLVSLGSIDICTDFACLVYEDGTAGDCEVVTLPTTFRAVETCH